MARIRTIKPAFFKSLTIAELPIGCRLTFIGLWTYMDDVGRGMDDARLIKGEIWPLDDTYTAKKIEADLVLLAKKNLIARYGVDGKRYLLITTWAEHQRINRPQPSRLPPPVNDHGTITDPSLNGHGKRSEGSVKNHGAFTANAPQEVEVEVEVEVESPQAPLPPTPTATPNDHPKPKADETSQQSETPPPEPADPLEARWLTVVARPNLPLTRIDTHRTVAHLRNHLDPAVIDEIIGGCQAEATSPIHKTTFLLVAARRWATAHGLPPIPDVPKS